MVQARPSLRVCTEDMKARFPIEQGGSYSALRFFTFFGKLGLLSHAMLFAVIAGCTCQPVIIGIPYLRNVFFLLIFYLLLLPDTICQMIYEFAMLKYVMLVLCLIFSCRNVISQNAAGCFVPYGHG